MDKIPPELMDNLPSFLWFLFAVFALLLFHRPIKDHLLPKFSGFKGMGVELSFLESSMDDAIIELAEKYPESTVRVSAADRRRVLNRVKQHLDVFENVEILWVDDIPENNINERRMFGQLKVEIDIAKSNDNAMKILSSANYDLVFSDMERDGNKAAGIEFLEQFRDSGGETPVVFYIDKLDPEKGVPAKALGITNRPDELLHLTLDALEREKY